VDRIKALRDAALNKKNELDGFLIFNEHNQYYFAGVSGTACLLVPEDGEGIVYVYGVNYEQAKADAKGFRVELIRRGENLTTKIAGKIKASKMKRLALDSITHDGYKALAKEFRGKSKIKTRADLVWELRSVKDENERELMTKAGELTVAGMKAGYECIRPGMREIEVAAQIEYAMRSHGSWGTAFETSVASGTHSAYPHGGCTEKQIRKGDLVVIDIGAKYQHYCSDMTRTLAIGTASPKQVKLHKIVFEAYKNALQTIDAGVDAKEVDSAARGTIEKTGYGECFVHGLGHGVGLEVHEYPVLNSVSKDRLCVGNVVTNEPGIYLTGFGGLRIEDSVLVEKRPVKLTDGLYSLEPEN